MNNQTHKEMMQREYDLLLLVVEKVTHDITINRNNETLKTESLNRLNSIVKRMQKVRKMIQEEV